MRPPYISPVAPETPLSADFDDWGTHWDPKATSGLHKGKGQHKGLDFACPVGTRIHAIAGGVVREVTSTVRGGLYVWIEHRREEYAVLVDGEKRYPGSSYHHLSEAFVRAGQLVTQGDIIAKSGQSGTNCTGPHLHLTVRDPAGPAADNRVDPRPFAATPYLDIGPEHYGFEAARWAHDPLGNDSLPLVGGVAGELQRDLPLTTARFLVILYRFWASVMVEVQRLIAGR